MTFKNTLSTLAHQLRAHLALLLVGTFMLTTSSSCEKAPEEVADDASAASNAPGASAEQCATKSVANNAPVANNAQLATESVVSEALKANAVATLQSFRGADVKVLQENITQEIDKLEISKDLKGAKTSLLGALAVVAPTKKAVGNSSKHNVDDVFALVYVREMAKAILLTNNKSTLDQLKTLGDAFVALENKGKMTEAMLEFVKNNVKHSSEFPTGSFIPDKDSREAVKMALAVINNQVPEDSNNK